MELRRLRKFVCFAAALALLVSLVSSIEALAGDTLCTGSMGPVSVDNLRVPSNADCTLNGTVVAGNITIEDSASLHAYEVRVDADIKADKAASVNVYAGSSVGGNIQIKNSGAATIELVQISKNLEMQENNLSLHSTDNIIGGDLKASKNTGGLSINTNTIAGNLQCKDNSPAPTGSGNIVLGKIEDQCLDFDAAPQLVAYEDAYTLTEIQISVPAPGILENDTISGLDLVEVVLVTPPQHGTLTLGQQGDFVYTAQSDYLGEDSFVYLLTRATIESNPAPVHLSIIDQAAPTVQWIGPVPEGERYDIREGEQVLLEVEASDNRGIEKVTFLRWDSVNEQYVTLGTLAQPPFRLTVSAAELNPAWNQVFVIAADLAGNSSASAYIWLYKIVEGQVEYKFYLPVAEK